MWKFLTVFILMGVLIGCAGTPFQAGASWSNDEARYFDDGIDIIGDFEKLSGKFRFDADEELEGRVKLADMVALVTLGDMQVVQEMGGPESRRVQATLGKVLYGEAPEGEPVLISSEESRGYTLMVRHEDKLHGQKLLFIRYFRTPEGGIDHHFHLAPDSDYLLERVQSMLDERVHTERMAAAMQQQ